MGLACTTALPWRSQEHAKEHRKKQTKNKNTPLKNKVTKTLDNIYQKPKCTGKMTTGTDFLPEKVQMFGSGMWIQEKGVQSVQSYAKRSVATEMTI